jgi:hypothetical protein
VIPFTKMMSARDVRSYVLDDVTAREFRALRRQRPKLENKVYEEQVKGHSIKDVRVTFRYNPRSHEIVMAVTKPGYRGEKHVRNDDGIWYDEAPGVSLMYNYVKKELCKIREAQPKPEEKWI